MKILFIGTHGQNNVGDEMLLQVFVDKLGGSVEKWYINSYTPAHTKKQLKMKNVHTFHTRKNPIELIHYIYSCDAIILGGGSLIKELYPKYGSKRYGTLNLLLMLVFIGKNIFKKPIYMSNIGAGPLETAKGKRKAQKIINSVDFISARDNESLRFITYLGSNERISKLPDAVFGIEKKYLGVPQKTAKRKKSGRKKTHLTLGLNLCRNIKNNENWSYFIDNLVQDIVKFCNKYPNVDILGLPMQTNTKNNNDYEELKKLKALMRKKVPSLKFKIASINKPKDTAKALASCDAIIAERLHCLILATMMSVPFIALEYDPKVTNFIQDMHLAKYGVDINKRFGENIIFKKLDTLIDNRDPIITSLQDLSHKNRELVDTGFGALLTTLQLETSKGENKL